MTLGSATDQACGLGQDVVPLGIRFLSCKWESYLRPHVAGVTQVKRVQPIFHPSYLASSGVSEAEAARSHLRGNMGRTGVPAPAHKACVVLRSSRDHWRFGYFPKCSSPLHPDSHLPATRELISGDRGVTVVLRTQCAFRSSGRHLECVEEKVSAWCQEVCALSPGAAVPSPAQGPRAGRPGGPKHGCVFIGLY